MTPCPYYTVERLAVLSIPKLQPESCPRWYSHRTSVFNWSSTPDILVRISWLRVLCGHPPLAVLWVCLSGPTAGERTLNGSETSKEPEHFITGSNSENIRSIFARSQYYVNAGPGQILHSSSPLSREPAHSCPQRRWVSRLHEPSIPITQ